MFTILIHDEFDDSPPHEYHSFDNLKEAYRLFNGMRAMRPDNMYDDGCELVLDRDADDGFSERITLDYFTFIK